ncbi:MULTISPECIES: aldehyde dehydrogenase family protein [unclassified Brenneria]|uniref:aldehyde dehydrogenase family protein n=1 Tax=unclassified Brenneria TaxID=2634434 RepID=UPI0029C5707F|nr:MULTISPECIES: aldehyde dehydrogenase family protein [unclassified Brenneria]MDX5630831.1 aldehyde dehydrogenase family protein [Brenneria sp. L3-3Z]MDX5697913.1 aldehyde dehydrogenase family protein [Brenneria sp. L4-2C]MEE3663604.1 aldehyde dehydrogenase family protein [Brenneria sp. g21c3]
MNDLEISQAVSRVLSKYTKTAPQAPAPSAPVAEHVNLEAIVASVLANRARPEPLDAGTSDDGAFATMDEAIAAAQQAQIQYRHCSMQDRAGFVDGIRKLFLQDDVLQAISRMAVEETGMGNYADKLVKNRVAALKTPGVEDLTTGALSGDNGLTLTEYSAYGVIGSITPTTNPTETIINNSIGMLAAGNTVVFSPHPRSRAVSLHCVALINQRLARLGAPANLVVTVTTPSIANTNALINDPRVNMLVATGGPAIVKTVMSSGKKAIGAGAGNPPAVVDETANIEKAARDIINGCSFDNNLPCVAEKEVIVVNEVADYLIHCMKKSGALLLCDRTHIQQLQSLVLNDKGTGPNTAFVGKDAGFILQQLGISTAEEVKVILIETERDHPFVIHELMMPILPVVRVENVDEAIELAIKVEHGNRHTAIMHSTNVEKLTKMARLIQTTIFVKNGPSYAGIGVGGEGHATFTIAGPTGEGLTSARTFARNRRCVMVEALNIR